MHAHHHLAGRRLYRGLPRRPGQHQHRNAADRKSAGIIQTPLHGDYENSRTFFNTLSPSGRTGSTKDAVDAVLYLTDAGFISGVALPVDGGATAGAW